MLQSAWRTWADATHIPWLRYVSFLKEESCKEFRVSSPFGMSGQEIYERILISIFTLRSSQRSETRGHTLGNSILTISMMLQGNIFRSQ